MNLLLLSAIILASFTGLAALFLRLQKDLNGCVSKIASRDSDKFQAARTCEFYNAFPDRQPRGARMVRQREAA